MDDFSSIDHPVDGFDVSASDHLHADHSSSQMTDEALNSAVVSACDDALASLGASEGSNEETKTRQLPTWARIAKSFGALECELARRLGPSTLHQIVDQTVDDNSFTTWITRYSSGDHEEANEAITAVLQASLLEDHDFDRIVSAADAVGLMSPYGNESHNVAQRSALAAGLGVSSLARYGCGTDIGGWLRRCAARSCTQRREMVIDATHWSNPTRDRVDGAALLEQLDRLTAALHTAPLMVNLDEHLCWTAAGHARRHGDLEAMCVSQQVLVISITTPQTTTPATTTFNFTGKQQKLFFKIDPQPSFEKLRISAANDDARASVAQHISLLALGKGVQQQQHELLTECWRECLLKQSDAPCFVARMLDASPSTLRPVVALPILEALATTLSRGERVEHKLLEVAGSDTCRLQHTSQQGERNFLVHTLHDLAVRSEDIEGASSYPTLLEDYWRKLLATNNTKSQLTKRLQSRSLGTASLARPEASSTTSAASIDKASSSSTAVRDDDIVTGNTGVIGSADAEGDDDERAKNKDAEESTSTTVEGEFVEGAVPQTMTVVSSDLKDAETCHQASTDSDEKTLALSVIAEIRSGFGLLDDDAVIDVSHNLQLQALDNALKVIARDIYSQDSHFLLELIQNADDNSYADGVCPSILFDTSGDCIVVRNNEKGQWGSIQLPYRNHCAHQSNLHHHRNSHLYPCLNPPSYEKALNRVMCVLFAWSASHPKASAGVDISAKRA